MSFSHPDAIKRKRKKEIKRHEKERKNATVIIRTLMLDEHACSRTSKRKANVDRSQECNEEKKEINDCKARFGHEFIS